MSTQFFSSYSYFLLITLGYLEGKGSQGRDSCPSPESACAIKKDAYALLPANTYLSKSSTVIGFAK